MELAEVLADLAAESAQLDTLVADLPAADWDRPTPAAGWTIAHQIAHLSWTDGIAAQACQDSEAFAAIVAMASPHTYVADGADSLLAPPAQLLARWRQGRSELAEALTAVPANTKISWFGAALSATTMATARIMETWAHGLDVAKALGVAVAPTARLRHIAFLGHRTLAYSFLAHNRRPPQADVYVELTAPDGAIWAFGSPSAPDRVSGPALHFCLLVTQRRHRDDLALTATGPVANEWLDVAQAFAGPPGAKQPPRGRVS
jgi:uncharacterized protein (TIGR03084 family)